MKLNTGPLLGLLSIIGSTLLVVEFGRLLARWIAS